ncbi:hypothetical protein GGTG_11457 [Gaeumannomyces tritici R3-111a-1]|uniref:Uncharacterized protein n=1 Tax=Gaeumannomyces tritici (strain R3-111a-1) TaxID=644352 RepID=J3PD88_GAET3|nr:hypothetical protein GGTG_11457 [Gaeumannomyces tritici R3-111a-1]EJT70433.1 hypothetical protein GGTG_11457 [Gaeumannomyces tritici R3-111a-1]
MVQVRHIITLPKLARPMPVPLPMPPMVCTGSVGPSLPSRPSFSPPSGTQHMPGLPGVRCPTCASKGNEVWVIPGRACGYCGTPCC